MHARARRVLLIGTGALTAVVVAGRNTLPGRMLRRGVDVVARQLRYAEGRLRGLQYRLSGRHPDPEVPDDVLADRIRSVLGPIEKRLDVPRVHVMVEDHVVLLHGAVPTAGDAATIEREVRHIPGVRDVQSSLHVGLDAGDTRPSAGRAANAQLPSPALRLLLDAAHDAGVPESGTRHAVQVVLATFAERLPVGERDQLLAHLPADVRELVAVSRPHGEAPTHWRTVAELVTVVADREQMDPPRAEAVTRAVLAQLRHLVPEEAADVAAVLPDELRALWTAPVPN